MNDKLPLCSDINSHPPVHLLSRQPVTTAASEWTDAWFNTTVVNRSLITDPTVCPAGFNLPRRLWSTLNRFRTGQGRRAANLVRWHQASDPSCICGTHDTHRVISSVAVQLHLFLVWFVVEANRNSFSFSAPIMGYLVIFSFFCFRPKMNFHFCFIFHFRSKNVICIGLKMLCSQLNRN